MKTLKELVAEYNALTGQNVKKFTDRKTAERRLEKAKEELTQKPKKEGKLGVHRIDLREVVTEAQESKKIGRKPKISDNAKLKVLVAINPKRGYSAKEFEYYRGAHTVGDFIAAGGRRSTILWDLAHNLIQVEQ